MALIRLISEEEATGKVKDIFADIKQTKGIDFVPNIWRALATCPEHLEVTWQKLKTIMRPGKLDALSKEIIALAVSITNGCEY
jgi:alkylhydroperoxidase family enzyme